MSRRGWALFAAMGIIWGIPYLLIKVAVGELSPPSLVFLRTATGAILLLPVAAARGNPRALLPLWRTVVLYTLVEIAVPWLLLSQAELRLSSSLTGLLLATVPLLAAILARITGAADRMNLREFGGLVIGFAGVTLLVGLSLSGGNLGSLGEMALVAICYAVGPMIIARKLGGVPALGVVAVSLALTAIAYAPVGIAQLPASLPSSRVVAAVAALSIVCTAIAFLVFFALIAEVGPVRAMIITYVNPAVALALGVLLLHEPLTIGAAIGFALILCGSFLSTRRSSRHREDTLSSSARESEAPATTAATP